MQTEKRGRRPRRLVHRLGARAFLTVALATLLTFPAAAQEGATLPPGSIYLTEAIEVAEGETLTIGPGTSVTGPGNITVWGTLIVNGTEGSPAEFSVQLRILSGGRADLRQARIWGVNATALEVFGGEVEMRDVLLEANTRAALVRSASRFDAADVVFRDHAGEALYVEESATVRLERATFSGNGRGVTLYSAREFVVNDSTFVANAQHLVVDLGPWSATDADIALTHNRFHAPASTPAQLPSIVLRHDPPFVDAGQERAIRMASNRIEGAPVGLRIEGRGLAVESTNDSFLDNGVGLSVQQSSVSLAQPTFGNDRDIEGSGRVTIEDATYLRDRTPPSFPPDPSEAQWLPWAIGAGVVAVLAAALVVPRLARPRTARAPPASTVPLEAPPAAPPPRPAPAEPDLAAAISPVERRVLEDILDHPGTTQRAVADRLGYTRQALHYHVKKLEARGLVQKRVEGRETRCEVPAAVASLVAATRTRTQEKG